MANISKIKLPNNVTYDIVDSTALHSGSTETLTYFTPASLGPNGTPIGDAIAVNTNITFSANTPTTISYTEKSIPNVTAAGTASVSNGILTITNTTLGTAISADDITAYSVGTAATIEQDTTYMATDTASVYTVSQG